MRSPVQIAASLLELETELDRPGRPPGLWSVREDLRQARSALDPHKDAVIAFAVDAPVPSLHVLANRARWLRDELDLLLATSTDRQMVLGQLAPAHRSLSMAVTQLLIRARFHELAKPAPAQPQAAAA